MGQACCAGQSDKRMVDYSIAKNKDYDPSASTLNAIKFPMTKKPKKHRTVQDLQQVAGGPFVAKNTLTVASGTISQPRQLNSAGLIYHGQWHNGIPHGKGELYYPDGSYYNGCITKGKADGQGRFTSPQGWYYEGQLENEQAQGKGILHHRQIGYTYDGAWSGDSPNGYGREQWEKTNITYSGQFLNGKKHGEGKYENNELTYEGSFNNDQFDSYGTIIYKNGDKFQGNFEKGLKNGKGVYTWKDGSYYEGSYKDDLKHGQGKYKSTNAIFWEGIWKQGKRDGTGKLTAENKKLVGKWADGTLVKNNIANSQMMMRSQVSFNQK